jgi:NADH-quinone oxidoreductase subunit C
LHNMPKNIRVRIKTFFDITKPEIPTVTDLWAGANWMERESFDFYGIRFKGHPNLTRILNVDEMDIFPLRKEYPLEDQTRDDKEDKLFGR